MKSKGDTTPDVNTPNKSVGLANTLDIPIGEGLKQFQVPYLVQLENTKNISLSLSLYLLNYQITHIIFYQIPT